MTAVKRDPVTGATIPTTAVRSLVPGRRKWHRPESRKPHGVHARRRRSSRHLPEELVPRTTLDLAVRRKPLAARRLRGEEPGRNNRTVGAAAGCGSARASGRTRCSSSCVADEERRTGEARWILIAGVSPRRAFDEAYGFIPRSHREPGRLCDRQRKSVRNGTRRAEALTAIDRAKTTFFSNVSHEFPHAAHL